MAPRRTPLSDKAKDALHGLLAHPTPYSEINAGIIDRLMREDLIETVMLQSPYRSHKGKKIRHVRLTQAGLNRLKSEGII